MSHTFDPELSAWISMLPVLDVSDVGAARELLRSFADQRPAEELPQGVGLRRCAIPGSDGAHDVPLLIFSPPPGWSSPSPALVYLHGGGFVVGSAETDLTLPAQLAAQAGATIVSVEYRLAPEHPYPAALEDCYAALVWTAEHAGELRVDPERIGVGGVSAGGGLAAATALLARDRGGPQLCLQMLDIPELDDRLETPSMRAFVDTPLWNLSNARHSWRHYLGPRSADEPVPAYAAPSRASNLSGLPPAYVSVCAFDPLRDEGIDYAQRLVQQSVPTELHLFPGTFHGSSGSVPMAGVSQRMRSELIRAVSLGLGAEPADRTVAGSATAAEPAGSATAEEQAGSAVVSETGR